MRRSATVQMLSLGLLTIVACRDTADDQDQVDTFPTGPTVTQQDDDDDDDDDGEEVFDTLPDDDTPGGDGCATDGSCDKIDLLFIIDNSGTMGEEQINLAANFPALRQLGTG